ncbi:SPFH domain Band 7 family protein [Babesia ovis]|uniref:SPFH domain Band 7 family protein n=1 Tax=Babesia ovis TaxID=5869 RepID=A0A9W5TEL2_BABOV|nr:SPFH domain Band 7 family protein [Babesia ovis]
MNSIVVTFFALLSQPFCLGLNVPSSQSEAREKFSNDDLPPHRVPEPRTPEFEAARMEELFTMLKMSGIDTDRADKLDDRGKEILSRMETLVGPANARLISLIASMAEEMRDKVVGDEEVPKEKTTTYLLEQILSTLDAQGGEFNYDKIGEALDKWMATLMPAGAGPTEAIRPIIFLKPGHIVPSNLIWSPKRYVSSFQRAAAPVFPSVASPLPINARHHTTINYLYNKPASRSHVGLVVVPQQTVYVIERFGKFRRTIEAGVHVLLPFIDKIAYVHSLKEDAIVLPNQTAITKDNVILQIDGVLYIKCVDPYHASYGIEDPIFAMTQMAQTTMRSELGKLSLDTTFLERDNLNQKIVEAINSAASNWGMVCMRYEIRDITLPKTIVAAMERQVEAERAKRALILRSEGDKESEINMAISQRQIAILQAEGDAIAERERADATAYALNKITRTLNASGTVDAVSLRLAEKYIAAFSNLAKKSNTVVLPANVGGVNDMVTQAVTLFKSLSRSSTVTGASEARDPITPVELTSEFPEAPQEPTSS